MQLSTNRKKLLTVLGALGLLGVLGLGYRLFLAPPAVSRWITQPAVRGDIVQVVSATGTLQPMVLSPVGSQVSGIVWKIHADYNDRVKQGQVLVELDPALFKAAVRREEANVVSAKALAAKASADLTNNSLIAERSRTLADGHYIALADRDTALANKKSARALRIGARANIQVARAALDRAQLDLRNSVVRSPVDGVVIARNVELGQAVVSSFQAPNIYTIAQDLTKMQVLANVDEADIGYLSQGQKAHFTVDSYRGRRFAAEVAQVRNAPQTVQNVVTYVVVMNVDNRERLLKPGMTANVRLEVASRHGVVLIPSAALRFKPKLDRTAGGKSEEGATKPASPRSGAAGANATVYVPDGDKVRAVTIVPGITDGMLTEVVSGLSEGQTVVTDLYKKPGASSGSSSGAMGSSPGKAKGLKRGGF